MQQAAPFADQPQRGISCLGASLGLRHLIARAPPRGAGPRAPPVRRRACTRRWPRGSSPRPSPICCPSPARSDRARAARARHAGAAHPGAVELDPARAHARLRRARRGSGKTLCTARLAAAYALGSDLPVICMSLRPRDGGEELTRLLEPAWAWRCTPVQDAREARARIAGARDHAVTVIDTPAASAMEGDPLGPPGRRHRADRRLRDPPHAAGHGRASARAPTSCAASSRSACPASR